MLLALLMIFSLAGLAIQPTLAQGGEEPAAPQAGWFTQTIEESRFFTDMTDRSMRFDLYGDPHIAFGGEHLYYARWNPASNSWFITTVDYSPKVGRFASLTLDSLGNPRIAYYDETNGALKFAFSQNGGYNWNAPFTVATFGPVTVTEQRPDDITIEQALAPMLAKETDSLAGPDAVEETGVGGYTSITTDNLNQVHISYYDWAKRSLKYARWDGVNWIFQTVDEDLVADKYDVGKYSSIAVNAENQPRISYLDEKYDGLRYATSDGTNWDIKDIDTKQAPNYRFGGFTSLVLNNSGQPFISYMDFQNYDLLIASPAIGGSCSAANDCRSCGPGDSWQCRVVDGSSTTGFYTSLGRDGDGRLMISYQDYTNGDLRLAQSSNGRSWSRSTLVSDGDTGYYTSLAFDGNNRPGISYYTASNGLYAFIRWDGSNWINSGLVYAGKITPYSSLTIKPTVNAPYISYFNDVGDQLRLAVRVGTNWDVPLIATKGGSYSSTRLAASGEPRIAYYDLDKYDLMYAYRLDGVWYFQRVDETGDVGMYPSLALDSADRPYISYYDATNYALKFAYWNGSAWVVNFVEISNAEVGTHNSLALSKNASNCLGFLPTGVCPMISYYDYSNKTLKFTFLSVINAWATPQVVDSGNVGQYSSIAIDDAGQLHISYYDAANGRLKHALGIKGATAWSWPVKEVVDSGNNVGLYSSIATDTSNRVHISYYDATAGDLKYALQSGGMWSKETVESAGDVGLGTSLALFGNGQPGISFYDASNGAIKFTTNYTGPFGLTFYIPLVAKN
jgi:hypothetical protein